MHADLHLHSTASDGEHSPQEVVRRAVQAGFDTLALTDHDSVEGLAQAREAADALGVRLIPGVELSCGAQKEIHILGYGFDTENAQMRDFCARRRAHREERAERIVRRLCELGRSVSLERVRELARGVIARPHIARAMVEAGHVATVAEAFERYLNVGRPAYEPKEEVKVAEAAALIAQAGGVMVLAHPMELKLGSAALESLVAEWHAQGLAGLEVYHPSAQNNQAAALLRLARREGLLVTGGSDFHGEAVRPSCIGEGLERWVSMEQDVRLLLSRIGERKTEVSGCRV